MLLNHKDNLDSMFTLAHEMGHALHSYHSCANQPVSTADYVIFVAEVASTVNEVLLMRRLLEKTVDKKARAYLINHFLDQFKGTVYRQTMFAEFELMMGKMAEEGAALTADTSKLNDVTVTGAKNVANSALYENYTVTRQTQDTLVWKDMYGDNRTFVKVR